MNHVDNNGPRRSAPSRENRKTGGAPLPWTWIVLLCIVTVLSGAILLNRAGLLDLPWGTGGMYAGEPIKEGTPGMTQEEILAALQERADKSAVSISINARPVFPDGKSAGNLYIVNPANNNFYMNIEIVLDDTEEVIYRSGLMAPNHYIDNDSLLVELPKGEHEATAYLYAHDLEDPDKRVNTATAALILKIEN